MTNEIFEPVGLLEITKQLKTSRNKLDDLTERMQTALDAKRDVASDYANQLDTAMKRNESLWKDGYRVGLENGERKGYDEGYKAASEKRDRELLEAHGYDIDELVDDVAKMIEDKDEDEPDQYQPEPEKWGGTK